MRPLFVDVDRKVWVLRWLTLIQFNGKTIPTAAGKLDVKFAYFPFSQRSVGFHIRPIKKKHRKKNGRDAREHIDAVRYYIHGRLILPTEKLPVAIYHDRSHEAARIIPAVALRREKRDRRISVRGRIQGDKTPRRLKTSNREKFLSILATCHDVRNW